MRDPSFWSNGGWQLLLLIAGLLVVLAACAWLATRLVATSWPRLLGVRDRLVRWARPKRANPLALLIVSLLDPERTESAGLLAAAMLVLGGGWAFFALLEDVLEKDPLVLLDQAVFSTLQGLRTPGLDHAMVAVTELGSAAVIVPVVVAVGLVLAFKRQWRTLGYWVATIVFGRALVWVLKTTVQRARPNQTLYSGMVDQFSFPSGHAASSIVLYGFLAFLLARGRPRGQRVAIGAVAAAVIVLTSFSRLYLGAHWMSDVLGSLALGTAWVALASVAFSWHADNTAVPQRALLSASVAALVVAGTIYLGSQHAVDMQRYAVQAAAPRVELPAWRAGGWRSLPERRVDLARELHEPMSLQWAAPAARIEQALRAAGWQPAAPLGVGSLLAMLAPQPALLQLPLAPEFHDGTLPVLRYVHAAARADQRLVLRLWSTSREVRATGPATAPVPLWIGSVERQSLQRFAGLLSWARANVGDATDPPLGELQRTFADAPPPRVQVEPVPGRALLLLETE